MQTGERKIYCCLTGNLQRPSAPVELKKTTICKGSLLINIGKTQVPSHEQASHIDVGCRYLEAMGYDDTTINIVRFKSAFEKDTPEPRLVIGVVKAAYLYHLRLGKYQPKDTTNVSIIHHETHKMLKAYATVNYLNPLIYHMIKRLSNKSDC